MLCHVDMTSWVGQMSIPFILTLKKDQRPSSYCYKITRFLIGPKAQFTHQKQIIMHLDDVIAICKDEALTNTINVF